VAAVYAFVHIDKTGGTTLTSVLRRSFGTGHCDIRLPLAKRRVDGREHLASIEAADLRRVKRLYRNLSGIAGHNVKAYADLEAECPSISYFTVLRDPAARFRSHFLNRGKAYDAEAFDRWSSNPRVHNWQTRMIAGEANARKAIDLLSGRFGFVGVTERFDESLLMLGQWLCAAGFRAEYRRLNQLSDKRRPHDIARQKCQLEYLNSDRIRARIQEMNSEDQQVYDFVTATVYPRQVAAFAGDLEAELREFQRRNERVGRLRESMRSRFVRNYVYKPLLHCYAI
jgi:hypothetical protein